jgi:uncharacterized delta-60 repeat protein
MANFFGVQRTLDPLHVGLQTVSSVRLHDCYSLSVSLKNEEGLPKIPASSVLVNLTNSTSGVSFYATQSDCYLEANAITQVTLSSQDPSPTIFYKIYGSGTFTIKGEGANLISSETFLTPSFTSFSQSTGFNGQVLALAIQSDGKIIVGGQFTSFGSSSTKYLARLNSDGTLDSNFATNMGLGFDDEVDTIAIQSNGKIIVGGAFTHFNGTSSKRIARLNTSGTLDTSFTDSTSGFDAPVYSITIQPDGKIIVGGAMTDYMGRGGVAGPDYAIDYLVRLNSDSTVDTTFLTNFLGGVNLPVLSTAVLPDGSILVGGQFTMYDSINPVPYFIKLDSNGNYQSTFTTNLGAFPSDEVHDFGVIHIEADHFGRAPGGAP